MRLSPAAATDQGSIRGSEIAAMDRGTRRYPRPCSDQGCCASADQRLAVILQQIEQRFSGLGNSVRRLKYLPTLAALKRTFLLSLMVVAAPGLADAGATAQGRESGV